MFPSGSTRARKRHVSVCSVRAPKASAKVIPPKPKAKGKAKAKGRPKLGKAKAKGKAKAAAALPAEEELSDGAAEDVPAVVEPPAAAEDLPLDTPWAMAARTNTCTHWHINVIHCSCTLIA